MNTTTPPATQIGLLSALESLSGTIATLQKRAQELEDGLDAVLSPTNPVVDAEPEAPPETLYAPAVETILTFERRIRALSAQIESITVRVAL